jgi:hypothetical protein
MSAQQSTEAHAGNGIEDAAKQRTETVGRLEKLDGRIGLWVLKNDVQVRQLRRDPYGNASWLAA